jgi:hypothetical protein
MSNNVLTEIFTPIVVAILLIVWIGGVFRANAHPGWGRRRDIKTEVSGGAFKAVHGGRQLMPIPGNWSQDVPAQRGATGSETYQADDVELTRPSVRKAADRPLVGASVSGRATGASASGRPAPGASSAARAASLARAGRARAQQPGQRRTHTITVKRPGNRPFCRAWPDSGARYMVPSGRRFTNREQPWPLNQALHRMLLARTRCPRRSCWPGRRPPPGSG